MIRVPLLTLPRGENESLTSSRRKTEHCSFLNLVLWIPFRIVRYRVLGVEQEAISGQSLPNRAVRETSAYPQQRQYSGHRGTSQTCQRQTFVLYAMRVSKKKSASGLTIEFIATCSEVTCSPCCLTYSYAACSRSRSG